jgi:succinate dehydrogenase/fumarate reductase flavoprotein subunit
VGMTEALGLLGGLGAQSVQDANLVLVARALLTAAIARDESRGCHVRTDAHGLDPAQARSSRLTLRDGEIAVSPLRPGWMLGWAEAPLAVAG